MVAKKRTRSKAKKADEGRMQPTFSWWIREDYVKRRTNWMWRLRPYLIKKHEQCKVCEFNGRCHKIPQDEKATAKIAQGEECPDFKSVWKKILSDEKKYDWGF